MNSLFISFRFLCFAQRGGETQGLCVDGQIQGGVPASVGVLCHSVHPIALRLVRKYQGVDLGVGGRILGGGEGAVYVSPAVWSVRVMVPLSTWAVRSSRGTSWMAVSSAAAKISPSSWDWRVWAVQVRPSGIAGGGSYAAPGQEHQGKGTLKECTVSFQSPLQTPYSDGP